MNYLIDLFHRLRRKYKIILTTDIFDKRRAPRLNKHQFDHNLLRLLDEKGFILNIEDISYTGVRFARPPHWPDTVAKGDRIRIQMEVGNETHWIHIEIVHLYPDTLTANILERPKTFIQSLENFLDIVTSEVSEKRKVRRLYKGQFDHSGLTIIDEHKNSLDIKDISFLGMKFSTPPSWPKNISKGDRFHLQMQIFNECHPLNIEIQHIYPEMMSAVILDNPEGSIAKFEFLFTRIVSSSLSLVSPPGTKKIRYFEGTNNSFACIERNNQEISFFCFSFMSNFIQYHKNKLSTGTVTTAFISTNNIVIKQQEDLIKLENETSPETLQKFETFLEGMTSLTVDEKVEIINLSRK